MCILCLSTIPGAQDLVNGHAQEIIQYHKVYLNLGIRVCCERFHGGVMQPASNSAILLVV